MTPIYHDARKRTERGIRIQSFKSAMSKKSQIPIIEHIFYTPAFRALPTTTSSLPLLPGSASATIRDLHDTLAWMDAVRRPGAPFSGWTSATQHGQIVPLQREAVLTCHILIATQDLSFSSRFSGLCLPLYSFSLLDRYSHKRLWQIRLLLAFSILGLRYLSYTGVSAKHIQP